MKKCFTINYLRTPTEIKRYFELLVKPGLYQAAEIFYPYQIAISDQDAYFNALKECLEVPNFSFLLHLPYGPSNNLAKMEDIALTKNRLIDAIKFGKKLNVKYFTLHPGEISDNIDVQEALKLSIKNVQELADMISPLGMTLMVENLISSSELCVNPNDVLNYLTQINRSNVAFTFDIGHAFVAGYQNASNYLSNLTNYLQHLHLSDNFGNTDAHGLLGSGAIDFKRFFKYLKEINYRGYYCAEVIHQSPEELIEMAKLMDIWNN